MKANIIDGKIKVFRELPKTWKNYSNFRQASIELQQKEGFFDVVIPVYDDKTHKLGDLYWDEVNQVFTYPVTNIPQTELDARKEQQLDAKDEEFDILTTKRLLRTLVQIILEKTAVTNQDIVDISSLYFQYREGIAYAKGDRFNHEGGFYEVTTTFTAGEALDMKNIIDMYTKYVK